MPLLVSFNFPVKVFYSLPYHTVLLTVSDDITAKIISNMVQIGGWESILSLATSLKFSAPEEDILIKHVLRKKHFASRELRCQTLTNKNL